MKSIIYVLAVSILSHAFTVSGYLPSWRSLPTDSQYDQVDEINISFVEFEGSSGAIRTDWMNENISTIVNAMHARGKKALISFWGTGAESTLMGVTTNRRNLIHNLMNFIALHNLDGIDVDWEPQYVASETEMRQKVQVITDNLIPFLSELRDSMTVRWSATPKKLTIAIANKNQVWIGQTASPFVPQGFSNYVDRVHLMNYDDGVGSEHSTYLGTFGLMSGSVSHWIDQGVPLNKLVPGIPFYARCSWADAVSYSDIVAEKGSLDTALDAVSVSAMGGAICGYNGVSTIHKKTSEAVKAGLAGIMFWELGQDVAVENPLSLLGAIRDIVPSNSVSIVSQPYAFSFAVNWSQNSIEIQGTNLNISLINSQGEKIPLQITQNSNTTLIQYKANIDGVYHLLVNKQHVMSKTILNK